MHLAKDLGELGFRSVTCSDLERAHRTASILADAVGCPPPTVDARLRERELGWWSGHTAAETTAAWPAELAEWRAHRLDRPPGGESSASVVSRVTAALVHLGGAPTAASPALVVSHGGVISALERALGPDAGPPGLRPRPPTPPAGRGGHANLSGRWLTVGPDGLSLGDRFARRVSTSGAGGTLETT